MTKNNHKMLRSLDEVVERSLGDQETSQASAIYYGRKPELVVAKSLADFELKSYKFHSPPLTSRPARLVKIAGIQFKYPADPSALVSEQIAEAHKLVGRLLDAAGEQGVNIVCLQETWTMPFAFCTREHQPWGEFAEEAENGPTSKFLAGYAAKYNMVIVSPILERDDNTGVVWNTAVVLDADGRVLGKTRKNHIPRVGDFNESTYYTESTLGHRVFDTKFARIAVNICYGRHHPLNWLMYGLNRAEVVFNPSATIDSLSESLWGLEARNAAVANGYFVVAVNRVGTEHFPCEFTSGDGKPAHKDFGYFFGSSYIASPEASRTPFLSRVDDGLVIGEVDLNHIQIVRDHWGFQMTARLDLYAKSLMDYATKNQLL